MLGLKKNVKKTPVAMMMKNAYIAISPSKNDQWSGKAFLMALLENRAKPNRSSMALPVPESALGGLLIANLVASQVALLSHLPSETGKGGRCEPAQPGGTPRRGRRSRRPAAARHEVWTD